MNAQELTWAQQNLSIRIWRLTGSDASDVFCDFSHENNHNPTISVQNLVQLPYNCHRVPGSQNISNAGCEFTCVTFLSMKMTTKVRNSTISRGFGRQTINRARSQEFRIPHYRTLLWNNNRVSGASGSPDSWEEHQDLRISVQKQDLEISGSVGAKQNKQMIRTRSKQIMIIDTATLIVSAML